MKRNDVIERVNNQIITCLEKGVVPWRKPWNGLPKNYTTGKPYHGINVWTLTGQCLNREFDSNQWLTFNQAKELGESIKAGEKAVPIFFFSFMPIVDKQTEEEKRIPVWRCFSVFNVDQTTLQKPTAPEKESYKEDEADKKIDHYLKRENIHLINTVDKACYIPSTDEIGMPPKKFFESKAGYYETIFHEITHSTGAEKRLNRDMTTIKLNEQYAKEELIAELGSAYLCSMENIDRTEDKTNAAAYIQGWLKVLKDDHGLFLEAATKAEKAVDFFLNGKKEKEEDII